MLAHARRREYVDRPPESVLQCAEKTLLALKLGILYKVYVTQDRTDGFVAPSRKRAGGRAREAERLSAREETTRAVGPAPEFRIEVLPMKIVVDSILCEAYGKCERIAPDLFQLDDEGIAYVVAPGDLTEEQLERARGAVNLCPVGAIRLSDETGGRTDER